MELPDLKKLDKIIQLCRKRGVRVIKIDNIELTLSEDAPEHKSVTKNGKKGHYEIAADPSDTQDAWENLTPEEQLFYSVQSTPLIPEESKG